MKRITKTRGLMYFSRSENRGVVVLILLLIVLITIRYFQKSNFQEFDLRFTKSEIRSDAEDVQFEKLKRNRLDKSKHNTSNTILLRAFDPNTASQGTLNSMGIPSYISARILKYRESGGSFREPVDLYLIYGIDSSLVDGLVDYIEIDERFLIKKKAPHSKKHFELKIDINLADATQFAQLKGIGPVLSRRIINYRNSVGGFYKIDQLTEVYGIEDSLFCTFVSQLLVDSSQIQKIGLNTANFEELYQHPYLNRYEAKAILAYRRISGKFSSKKELRENYILSESTYQKAVNYFQIE